MPLSAGTRVGPYEIVSPLGAGGMGEVYRARDTKLDRAVAIKVLPELFVADLERVARFQREARTLAALNHPHIGGIYGLEDADGARALILELVEGPTLADRIAQGPIPLDEALPIARQIAEALEAAHEQGIVHRDLKPANVKLRPDGTVKVLDFGLAKALEPTSAASPNVTASPTITTPAMMTGVGMILGTAAYMSPEQARGKAVDKRADIWAFGAVLYEMLTGRRAFYGEDISLTLAEVMKSEPDWTLLPPVVSAGIRAVLKRCLQKDHRQRLHDIADVRLLMDAAVTESVDIGPVSPRRLWPLATTMGVAVTAAVFAGAASIPYFRSEAPKPVIRATFMLPEGQVFSNPGRRVVAISPDGTQLAYVANSRLYLRPLSALDARPIPGAEDQQGVLNPVFSPDGRSIAYWSANTIRRISINGGAAVTVCEDSRPLGITWQADAILFGQGADGIKQVPENGGKPQTLVTVRPGEVAHGPQLLPGGQAVLFTITSEAGVDRWDKARIVVQPLGGGERKMIIEGGSDARYLPTGHLLYALQDVLLAVPFDLGRLEIRGSAIPAVEGVLRATIPDVNSGSAHFDVSNGGLLAYADAGSAAIASGRRNLGFVDRKGNVEITKIPPGVYDAPRLSPDAKRIAYRSVTGADEAIYIFDLSGSAEPRRLTFGGRNRFPVWSADGARVAFQSDRDGDLAIFWQRADGTDAAERLTKPEPGTSHVPESWSPQGDMLLYSVFKDAVFSIFVLSLPDRKSERFGDVATSTLPQTMFSPDGKWVAYRSQGNVYVQPFPATQAKYQVTAGYAPAWSRDGQQLFFAIGPQRVGVVRMHIGPGVTIANREEFAAPDVARGLTIRPFDVTPDGRIVASLAAESAPSAQTSPRIHIVYNWFEELKARVPTK